MKRLAWLTPVLLAPALALAVTTQSFVVDTPEAFGKGKLEGTAVFSDGRVRRGLSTERTPLDAAAVAYASVTGPDGAIYVGTGNDGNIYRLSGEQLTLFARSGAALVTALLWAGDTLYAGMLEQGKVLALDRHGKARDFAILPTGSHVWGLAYDAAKSVLYAATGPEGKLFAIDKAGHPKLIHDDEAEHLLCLARGANGDLYVGTSQGARLVRVRDGKASTLYDAPGHELSTLALGKGFVAVASNEFVDPPAEHAKAQSSGGAARKKKNGKGKVFAVFWDGRVEQLYQADDAQVSALEIDAQTGAVYVGLGAEGRIVRVQRDRTEAVWADADERQIVSIHLSDRTPHFVSSDGVAVYRVAQKPKPAQWISAPLDAKVPARFGQLTFRSQGKVRFATRSGNTETPDATWSAWSSEASVPGPIHSAAARFLQVRMTLAEDAELYALEAYYLPQNLPAHVRNLRVKAASDKTSSKAPSEAEHATQITLTWDVDNPDDDTLRYRLSYRRDGSGGFLSMLQEHELLEKSEYRWDTINVPDGYYRVRVEASDELATPAPFIERDAALSAPILIDNHAPVVSDLRVAGTRLHGRAVDSCAAITRLELSMDGGHFFPIQSRDGLLDTAEETFEVDLGALAIGPHIAAVRATDAARNTSTAAVEFSVKR